LRQHAQPDTTVQKQLAQHGKAPPGHAYYTAGIKMYHSFMPQAVHTVVLVVLQM
jgi:hypothetical protein